MKLNIQEDNIIKEYNKYITTTKQLNVLKYKININYVRHLSFGRDCTLLVYWVVEKIMFLKKMAKTCVFLCEFE
jgi:hypothetical protein